MEGWGQSTKKHQKPLQMKYFKSLKFSQAVGDLSLVTPLELITTALAGNNWVLKSELGPGL